jgi:hypothetical protein
LFRALRSLLIAGVLLHDQKPLPAGQHCKPWAKEMARKKRLGAAGAERFDPFRVGKLAWRVIRGRRAQNPRPCPRLLNLNPFGVQTNPRLFML